MGYPGPQPMMVPGPIQYKRKYELWILVLLLLVFWPAALIYYFTRDKVPVQEFQPYAMPYAPYMGGPVPSAPMPAGPGPACPRCGRPSTWVPQAGRYYCSTDGQYI